MAKRSQAAKTVAKAHAVDQAGSEKNAGPKEAGRKTPAPAKATVRRLPPASRYAARKLATQNGGSKAPRGGRGATPKAPGARAPRPAPGPPVAARKPGFYEAVAIYERGVQALQRHDYEGAAGFFRTILDRYPDERELLERARLYLRVCERETARQPTGPKTPAERVYAATVALNSGDHTGALDHLQRALGEDPESDHAHYIMAVALGMRGRADEARRSSAARDRPESGEPRPGARGSRPRIRSGITSSFGSALNTPPAANRRRPPRRH